MRRIAFVSRELTPTVTAAVQQLAAHAEVTVLSSAEGADVRIDEPSEQGGYYSLMHAYSARVDAALRTHYGDRAPDVIEFRDHLGEGLVTLQARHTHDPWLERTLVCVRLHGTDEMRAVLDGHLPLDTATMAVHEAERYCLERADRLLWSGGDTLATYERFYGRHRLAPATRLRAAFAAGDEDEPPAAAVGSGPLRLRFAGRLERRRGAQTLLRALALVPNADVRVSLPGADSHTGPRQTSVRKQLELMAAGDERVNFSDDGAGCDVVVVPARWDAWPAEALEALGRHRPLLGTPVGGLTEMIVPGESGWLARDASPAALAEAIAALAADPRVPRRLAETGGPRSAYERLTDPAELVRGYLDLPAPAAPPKSGRTPLVSIVIPYYEMDAYIAETVASALAQTHPAIEVIVVVDGSLRDADRAVFDLPVTVLTQPNRGLSAARNFGIAQARGEYVLPLDADDMIAPTYVERCVVALERDPSLAYVGAWARYVEADGTPQVGDGWAPIGNWSRLVELVNVAGPNASVLRRSLFERGLRFDQDMSGREDRLLFRELYRAGHHGAVIPERLFVYRVRAESMSRTTSLTRKPLSYGEMAARLREREVRWTAI